MSAIVIDFFEKKAARLGLRTVTNYTQFTQCLSPQGREDLAKLQASIEKFAKLQAQFYQQKLT